ncbi:hypothetical protein [Hyphomicrobium sp. 99]|uniref:hypothetical protein n=1 Tax=Hyphomicrobium sp. 99 TaxID=1163419 RepID=UPI0005F77732|nr:hypothetical protein [Hyphomicrobium sp. 99]
MTSSIEDEAEFASLFEASRFATTTKIEKRSAAERRASATEGQRSRGGRARSVQMNFRCTPAFKAQSAGLAASMGVSIADMLEEAVAALAKRKGFKGAE